MYVIRRDVYWCGDLWDSANSATSYALKRPNLCLAYQTGLLDTSPSTEIGKKFFISMDN